MNDSIVPSRNIVLRIPSRGDVRVGSMKNRRRRPFDELPMRICFCEVADQRELVAVLFGDERDVADGRLIFFNGNQGCERVPANDFQNVAFVF